jgi:hypothetical protein
MKRALFLLALALPGVSLFSQRNFKPVTIVFHNGDTASGEINYQNWRANPSTILFRKDAASKPISYGPGTIGSFSVEQDTYKGAVVDIDDRFDDLNRVNFEEKIITHRDTLFLKEIVGGKKSLYHYLDNVDHFYIFNNDSFELLRYKQFKTRVENAKMETVSNSLQTNKDYIYQLFQYLDDCPELKRTLAQATYDLRSLKKSFVDYYGCIGTAVVDVSRGDHGKTEFGLLAGVSRTEFNTHAQRGSGATRLSFPTSHNFAGGVSLDVIFARARGRISFYNELLYSSYKTEGVWRTSDNAARYDAYRYIFKQSYLKLNSMLRFKVLAGNPAVFLDAGMSNTMPVAKTHKLEKYHKFDEYESTTTEVADRSFGTYDFALIAGGGIRTGRITVEVRGEKGTSRVTTFDGESPIIKFFALIGYRLK